MTQIDNKKHVYVFVRTDLPIQQQIVQSNHAAYEAGIFLGDKEQAEPASLIVIAVKNKAKLEKAMLDLQSKGINLIPFEEPAWDYGLTAFGTEPLTQDRRILLKRYQLWH